MAANFATVWLALVPLSAGGVRCHGVVVPLQSQRLLAEHIGLETPPSLQLEIVERAAMGAQPMWNTRREIHERAGLNLLGRLPDLDHALAFERDIAMRCAAGVGARADVPMIR